MVLVCKYVHSHLRPQAWPLAAPLLLLAPQPCTSALHLSLLPLLPPPPLFTQAAGGMSYDGRGSILDSRITSPEHKSIICLGSKELVQQVRGGGSPERRRSLCTG